MHRSLPSPPPRAPPASPTGLSRVKQTSHSIDGNLIEPVNISWRDESGEIRPVHSGTDNRISAEFGRSNWHHSSDPAVWFIIRRDSGSIFHILIHFTYPVGDKQSLNQIYWLQCSIIQLFKWHWITSNQYLAAPAPIIQINLIYSLWIELCILIRLIGWLININSRPLLIGCEWLNWFLHLSKQVRLSAAHFPAIIHRFIRVSFVCMRWLMVPLATWNKHQPSSSPLPLLHLHLRLLPLPFHPGAAALGADVGS